MTDYSPQRHKRNSDHMEHPHERISDPVLIDLLASVKINNNKLDTLVTDVAEIKKAGEHVKERLTRVEYNQAEMSSQLKGNAEYIKGHAEEEEKIFRNHVAKMDKFQEELNRVQRGFPKNEDGERDPRSHADDHEEEATKKKDYRQMWGEVKRYAIMALLGAMLSGVGYLLLTGSKVEIKRIVTEADAGTKK